MIGGEQSSLLAGAWIEKAKDEPAEVQFVFVMTPKESPKVLGGLMADTPNRPDEVNVFVQGIRPEGWFDHLKEWLDSIAQAKTQNDQVLPRFIHKSTEQTEMLLEPEQWISILNQQGYERGSRRWWEEIEKMVRAYRDKFGKRALPIKGKLERITGYNRKHIYTCTSLGDTK